MASYVFSRLADEDYFGLYQQGVEAFGVQQAGRYIDFIDTTLESLARHPRMARERTELIPPMRVHPCQSHIILYRIEPDETIFIVRIRHNREDWISDQS